MFFGTLTYHAIGHSSQFRFRTRPSAEFNLRLFFLKGAVQQRNPSAGSPSTSAHLNGFTRVDVYLTTPFSALTSGV